MSQGRDRHRAGAAHNRGKVSVLSVLKRLHLELHYPLFVANEVDLAALHEMSDDDLSELGINNSNDRRAILKYIAKLKK